MLSVIPTPPVIPAKAGIQTKDMNTVSLDPRLRGGDATNICTVLIVIAPFLLTASFAFAEGKATPIPLPNNVFIVENDQSVQKTEKVATIEHRPTSSAYVVRGRVQYRGVEGTAYLEMWNVMPDGSRYFSRTLAEYGAMRKIQGTSDWREFELPFNLMEHKPESVTLEINVVMPGKGTIELSELTVSDFQWHGAGEWFDARTGNFYGGCAGAFWGCFAGLIGTLAGILIPRGKGRKLLMGMIVFAVVMGGIHIVVGLTAFSFSQPYYVWYPFVLLGGLLVVIFPFIFFTIRKQYEQTELRKLQALDA